jgi:hypothetical protein
MNELICLCDTQGIKASQAMVAYASDFVDVKAVKYVNVNSALNNNLRMAST